MKIIVWGINYAPELTGIAPYNVALCEYLVGQGHEARMLTSFAYYPAWRKLPGEEFSLYRTDRLNSVPVHRCWHFVPRKVTVLKRFFHEGTFVFTSFLRLLFLPRADLLVVVSPPLLLGAAAAVFSKLSRTPFVFHVQDLQPDAAAGLGMVKSQSLVRALYWLEKVAYTHAKRVSGISPGMLRAFTRKNVSEKKQIYFPNGVHLPALADLPAAGLFRAANGFSKDDFLVVYSGNMGVKQGLEILIEAARLFKNKRVRIVLCGEGNQREKLEEMVREHRLSNVVMLPLQPDQGYRQLLVDADVCVVTQQAGSGDAFFPSKLLMTLAFGKTVLTVADESSALAHAVNEGKFGVNVIPGKVELLASAVDQMADKPEDLKRFAGAGRNFVEQFRFQTVLRNFENELKSTVAEPELK